MGRIFAPPVNAKSKVDESAEIRCLDPNAPVATSPEAPETPSDISQESIFRAFFNANRNDYMAYWDGALELQVANFQLDPQHMHIVRSVQETRKPAQFEAVQEGRMFDFHAYPALNAFGECAGIAVYAHDITARKEAESEVRRLAYYDPLTTLPNRQHLIVRLAQALDAAKQNGHWGALLFVDLDRFKNVNDSLGHDIGDLVLCETARRLEQSRSADDIVAHMGGDEFIWLIPDLGPDQLQAAKDASRAAKHIMLSFDESINADGFDLRISASIGMALFGDETGEVPDVIKQANASMHRAKASGSGNMELFRPHMQEAADERLNLESRLHDALDNNAFELHYQPQASVTDGTVIGAETLLRWNDSELGPVSPAKFIPIAEETGLILKIGAWVIETACAQIHAWNNSPNGCPLPRVAVNISPLQFRQPDFVSDIRAAMNRWNIRHEQLELELTEGIVIEQIDATVEKMKDLNAIGVRFAIDDFGTGYSSLAYLNKLPLDILKIDQSFVRNIGEDKSSEAIVASIITMAHLLEFELVAEGVETEPQLHFLRERGCQTYQGYLFGKPMPVPELEAFLAMRSRIF
tara:strand:+ start:16082 stop:17824 length:1743 start_codon:yes stop_codon:yes gene_type:complete